MRAHFIPREMRRVAPMANIFERERVLRRCGITFLATPAGLLFILRGRFSRYKRVPNVRDFCQIFFRCFFDCALRANVNATGTVTRAGSFYPTI